MLIRLKNKDTLKIDEFSFKCCIGKKGLKTKKVEGDLATPKGAYLLKKLYYRSDKFKKIETLIPKIRIKKNMGWCNDPNSKSYNRLIKYPINSTFEKLFRKDNIYDVIMVLNYNMKPIIKNKGSAIFLHISKKNYSSTEGCIAINKSHIKKLLTLISKSTKVKIV